MKPTLLVLAAGMGSRFGGLKQMEPVGPNGEWILDYSVSDACKAGFGKVVFVIRKEMEEAFRSLTEKKYSGQMELRYAFQSIDDLPIPLPSGVERSKPWGTGHAVYAARDELNGPFAVINADDYYGTEAFAALAEFLNDESLQANGETYALVGYRLSKTLSANGTVSRGVCQSNQNGELISIAEHSAIARQADGCITGVSPNGETRELPDDTLVSLNCWGFPKGWTKRLEPLFRSFLEEHGTIPKSEFYLPAAVDSLINKGSARALTLPCEARWLGVTYREDLAEVRAEIARIR